MNNSNFTLPKTIIKTIFQECVNQYNGDILSTRTLNSFEYFYKYFSLISKDCKKILPLLVYDKCTVQNQEDVVLLLNLYKQGIRIRSVRMNYYGISEQSQIDMIIAFNRGRHNCKTSDEIQHQIVQQMVDNQDFVFNMIDSLNDNYFCLNIYPYNTIKQYRDVLDFLIPDPLESPEKALHLYLCKPKSNNSTAYTDLFQNTINNDLLSILNQYKITSLKLTYYPKNRTDIFSIPTNLSMLNILDLNGYFKITIDNFKDLVTKNPQLTKLVVNVSINYSNALSILTNHPSISFLSLGNNHQSLPLKDIIMYLNSNTTIRHLIIYASVSKVESLDSFEIYNNTLKSLRVIKDLTNYIYSLWKCQSALQNINNTQNNPQLYSLHPNIKSLLGVSSTNFLVPFTKLTYITQSCSLKDDEYTLFLDSVSKMKFIKHISIEYQKPFLEFMKHSPQSLKRLTLNSKQIFEHEFFDIICQNQTIESLNISQEIEIIENEWSGFFEILYKKPNIRSLYYNFNINDDIHFLFVKKLIEFYRSKCPNSETLLFDRLCITGFDMHYIYTQSQKIQNHLVGLKKLDQHVNKFI
ncbi:hypothetical protein DLAC_07305 [Tieghemostelium lacteum]|uniref:Uncharacterized protein n=1 Tax=Tieghemostelium lacteum TaxID=361077 RepID=A0A151ZC66_TIELA|nr:hypothetical protein DLAC_07305 [Tieghemostelium lacteum]|eukprot:KYQ91542.1 hypothetical protein DLAC_07305 [Tieghemostelium lacteum]